MTSDEAFSQVVGFVLGPQIEGGYSNDPNDPGGETNHGISAKSYPGEDIKGMTVERATYLYRRDYWTPAGCDKLPASLASVLFDTAVNMGVVTAIKIMQRALGVADDGIVGHVTAQVAHLADMDELLSTMLAERAMAYAKQSAFPRYGRGWLRRCFHLHRFALQLKSNT